MLIGGKGLSLTKMPPVAKKQIARKNYIKPRLPELKDKCWELEKRVGDLEKKKLVEDEDVKRLEGHSLAAFVYAIIGKKEEQLDKERREAYEATAKYNADQIYRQATIDLQQQKELDITNDIYQNLLLQ